MKPNDPLKRPYTFGGIGETDDIGSWQLWWDFNKDPYLQLDAIDTKRVTTGDDDFYLGAGQRPIPLRGGRASDEEVRREVLPALYDSLAQGGEGLFSARAMLSLAKAARGTNGAKAQSLFQNFLGMPYVAEDKAAAISLGILERDDSYPLLFGLAFDTASGRKLDGKLQIDPEVRAFAIYGLGLLGRASRDQELRAWIVRDLVHLLEQENLDQNLRVAAMLSIGLVPLPIVEGAFTCVCGVCEVEGPESSLQSEVTYLMRYFTAQKEFDSELRAHAATTLARLLSQQDERPVLDIKQAVAELLISALDSSSREPQRVRESCVLGLGLIGDADRDPTDQWIRWALNRAVAGSYLERRFALVSIGLVGSRPGSGEEPFDGTEQARNYLVSHLKQGRSTLRPWAALGLGVMGHWLRAYHEELSPVADVALRNALRGSKRASDMGAFAIACGMRRDGQATEILLQKVDSLREQAARAYAVIGLGMIGDRSAIEPLTQLLEAKAKQPELVTPLGIALGLLGDFEIVESLTRQLEEADRNESIVALVGALGGIGDSRSIGVLAEELTSAKTTRPVREAAAVALGQLGDRQPLPWRCAFVPGTNYNSASESLTNSQRTGLLDVP